MSMYGSSTVLLVMPKMRSPPMPESRQGSARDLAPSFVMISTSLNFATFEDLVNRSFRAEHGNEVFEKSRKHALELAPSSSSRPQKSMIWIPNRLFHQNNPPRPSS